MHTVLLHTVVEGALAKHSSISCNLTPAKIKADGALLDNKVRASADDTCQATAGRPAVVWHCLICVYSANS